MDDIKLATAQVIVDNTKLIAGQIALDARRWYEMNTDVRLYHNWEHACEVGNAAKLMCDPSNALLVAAAWHDAVYVPGASGDANEQCSAAALRLQARLYSSHDVKELIEDAATLVEYTSIRYHLHEVRITGELAILLDADISALASDFIVFAARQDCIILEQGGDIKTDRSKCAEFLGNFLKCRQFIYHTDYGRKHWEEKAYNNISWYLQYYGT